MRASKAGFSLLEVVVAMGVMAVALVGTLSLLLVLHRHNTATNETAVATKACQEMMEQIRTLTYDQVKAQDGITFVANKLHPTQPLGLVEVTDISPAGDPDTLLEVRVRIQTQPGQFTRDAVNVTLVSWRSRR